VPEADTCRSCGGDVPPGSRFCPHCGTRREEPGVTATATIPPPPHETSPAPAVSAVAEPRLFGVTPAIALLVLSLAAFVVGTVALIQETRIVGGILLALGIVLLLGFLGAATRRPDGRVSAAAAGGVARTRDRLGGASGAWGIRAHASREAARVRARRGRVTVERERLVRELGHASYAGDADREAELRARLAALDARDRELRAELDRIADDARRRLGRTRLQAQPTESVVRPSEQD
jgi:hypothetical protein